MFVSAIGTIEKKKVVFAIVRFFFPFLIFPKAILEGASPMS